MDFSYWWSISNNFTWISFNLWQEYLCLICNGRESGRGRQRGNYLIEENFNRKSFEFIWDIVAFSLWNVFLNKIFIPDEKLSLPKSLPNKHFFWRYLKTFRLLKIDLPILRTAFSKRSAQFRYNTSINTRETLWP